MKYEVLVKTKDKIIIISVEDIHLNIRQNIESAIIQGYQEKPALLN